MHVVIIKTNSYFVAISRRFTGGHVQIFTSFNHGHFDENGVGSFVFFKAMIEKQSDIDWAVPTTFDFV